MIEKKTSNHHFFFFNSVNEMTDYAESHQPLPGRHQASLRDNDTSFTGTKTWDEAIKLCRYGDEKLRKQIEAEVIKAADLSEVLNKIKRTYEVDVVGFMPHVPNAVIGLPKTMIKSNRTYVPNRIVNVYINITAHCGIEPHEIRENASKCAAAINSLELQGYRCNVYSGNIGEKDGNFISSIVKIKTDREPLNLATMAFPMASPAMLRRYGFRFIELAKFDFGMGYGRPMDRETKVKEIFKEFLGIDKVAVFNVSANGGNIDNIVERFKKGGVVR